MTRDELLRDIRARLERAYGKRLRGVVLYGSAARGEDKPDSDIDVLVLLTGPVMLGQDIHTNVETLFPLMLDIERPIHAVPADVADYEQGAIGLYRIAKAEGITA